MPSNFAPIGLSPGVDKGRPDYTVYTGEREVGRISSAYGLWEVLRTALRRASAAKLAARAQQPAMPMVGFLSPQAVGSSGPFLDAFRRGLAETGHVEGQNVAIEHRMAGGQLDRLPALAADLVRLRASVIATSGSSAALAAKAATQSIPIAFSVPRPGQAGSGRKPRSAGRQCDRHQFPLNRGAHKAYGPPARARAHGRSGCGADRSSQPREYVGHAH
jgi:hypothetical protein